jgi:hypothetical protein
MNVFKKTRHIDTDNRYRTFDNDPPSVHKSRLMVRMPKILRKANKSTHSTATPSSRKMIIPTAIDKTIPIMTVQPTSAIMEPLPCPVGPKAKPTKSASTCCWQCLLCPLKCVCRIYRRLLPSSCCACHCKERIKYSDTRNRIIAAWNGRDATIDDDNDNEDIDEKFERLKYEMKMQELNQGVSIPTPQGTSSLKRAMKVRFWGWNDSIKSNNDKFLDGLEFDDLSNAGTWRKKARIPRVQLSAFKNDKGIFYLHNLFAKCIEVDKDCSNCNLSMETFYRFTSCLSHPKSQMCNFLPIRWVKHDFQDGLNILVVFTHCFTQIRLLICFRE